MSDISDIEQALSAGRRAVVALETWVRNVDGRDAIRSYTHDIECGVVALGRLRRDLHDGRKHVEPPENYERTSCGCGDPDASPPCSYCTTPRDDEAAS